MKRQRTTRVVVEQPHDPGRVEAQSGVHRSSFYLGSLVHPSSYLQFGQPPAGDPVLSERQLRKPVEASKVMGRRLPLGARLMRKEIARQLKDAPLFAHFDEATLKKVAERAQVVDLLAGRDVFRQGDTSNELYLLARGAAVRAGGMGRHDELSAAAGQ